MNDESDPIELTRRLVYLAAERTLTSWIRTALSLMALGFVIDRFELVLDLMPRASTHTQTYSQGPWSWSGSVLIGMGVAMALGAGVRYLRVEVAYYREGSTRVGHGVGVGAAFAMLLALFGVALIVLLSGIGR